MRFYKYHGTGNDFVLVDNRAGELRGDEYDYYAGLCHRRFGIGADGVILLNSHAELDFEMDYFNSDGRRSSMCGNGGRCIVKFAERLGLIRERAHFLAIDGPHEAIVGGLGVKLKMGMPQGYRAINATDYWIDTGSPHYVRFLDQKVADLDVFAEGRAIRNQPEYRAAGTNVNFANVRSDQLDVRTYERGVEDETWSCGTGVTAVASVYAQREGIAEAAIGIHTPGGRLKVHVNSGAAPWLEGPAEFVFSGEIKGPNR
ncbi:MAG: diaminopimelate epimerase [Bacteroidota bacterium]